MSKKATAIVAFSLALLLLLLRSIVPSITTSQVRLLQLNTEMTLTTETAEAVLFDAAAWERHTPVDPACGSSLSCYLTHPEVQATTTVTARSGATRKEADYSAEHSLTTDSGESLFHAQDAVTLVRHSSFPVDRPVAALENSSPLPGLSHHTSETIRDGLQYSFPFASEFRSYRYFDIFSASTTPIDFHDREHIRGETVYRFQQQLDPVQLQIGGIKGAASQFYSQQEIAEQGLAAASTVVMNQYYSMTRTLWVEPKTGIIVDSMEIPHIFLARDAVEAAKVQPDSSRTLFRATLRWDEATQDAMWTRATSGLVILHRVDIGLLATTISSAALVVAGIFVLRRRD